MHVSIKLISLLIRTQNYRKVKFYMFLRTSVYSLLIIKMSGFSFSNSDTG